jgi:glycosyltransferase involved in cell wall biosynthesis
MKTMKVAQVITRMDWGGSSDIVRIMTRQLDPQAYAVSVITGLTRFPGEKTKALFEDLKDRIFTVPLLRREINPFFDALAFVALYRLFRREKFDIVHTHTAKAGLLGRIAARAAGVPVIIHTPHGHNFYGYFGPVFSSVIIVIERLLSRITSRITVFTELEKEDFIRYRVISPEKISLISQGLELGSPPRSHPNAAKIKEALGIGPREYAVGMIGRLEPVKGPSYFIEAAARVAREINNSKFVIVGEGSLHRQLEESAQALGIRERCIFTGWREDAPAIMSILDVLVLPSLNEAVGMVLIEAQAQGVAVIASRVGGVPEVVKDNHTGILVSPGRPDELAEAIAKLLQDEGLRTRMGNNGCDWVKGKFGPEAMGKAISDLYAQMLRVR